jgi:hypothetical protein
MTSEPDFHTDELPIAELAAAPERVLGNGASCATLHYCSPAHGGWGVVRAALLVPESYLLFVCPSACGRHGAIAAIEQGYRHRIGYLCITGEEIVLGTYEEEIVRAVGELMVKVSPRPKALMIFVSCIDDLLGTDHSAALKRMEQEYGIPIKLARMNPISLDSKLPPGIRVQKTMYEFLSPAARENPAGPERGVLILGSYRPPARDSELAGFLASYGFGPLGHPEYCGSFEEFRELSRSAAALVLRPEGRAAGEDLATRLGMPVHRPFMAFDRESVIQQYRQLGSFLQDPGPGTSGPEAPSREEILARFSPTLRLIEKREVEAREILGDTGIAVDSTATIAPFSLALALVQAGLKVTHIYSPQLPTFEKPRLAELARLKGDIMVSNPNHSRNFQRKSLPGLEKSRAGIAIGFEAGYASAAPVTVPLAFDEQLFGFEGYLRVLEALIHCAAAGRTDLRQQVKEYGLVV